MGSQEQSLVSAKFADFDSMAAATAWDPLNIYFADLKQSPEQFLRTVDFVAASRPALSLVLMTNTETLMSSTKEWFWHKQYRLFREDDRIVAQVLSSVDIEELSGFPQEFPNKWMKIKRAEGKTTVVGVTVLGETGAEPVSASNVHVHIAACVEVVRGKLGRDVEIFVFVNRKTLTVDGEGEGSIKDMVQTTLGGATVFVSASAEFDSREVFDGGITLRSSVAGCRLCHVSYTCDTRDHEASVTHRRNFLYSGYQRNRDQLLQTPHDLGLDMSVSAGGDPDICVIENGVVEVVCKPEEEKSFKLILRNALPEAGHQELQDMSGIIVEDVGPLQEKENLTLTDEHSLCQVDDTKIRLKPGKKYKVFVKITGREVGQVKVPIMVTFYHESKSEKLGDEKYRPSNMAMELLIKTQNEEIASMQATVSYVPPASKVPWRARETVRGKPIPKLDSLDALEIKIPVAINTIGEIRKRVINSKLERCGTSDREREEFRKCKEILKKGLNMENYAEFWNFMLHCERYQEEKDVRYFDLHGVPIRLERNSGLCVLEVPGLAESRPSVLKGDRLYAKESGVIGSTVEYEGVVHFVGEKTVSLGFSDKMVAKVSSQRAVSWDVRFDFSPFTYFNMHRAVQMSSNLHKILFPATSYLPAAAPLRPVECFDNRVANNPEQLAAVQAIVSQVSGPAPYLVFGPPGTGKTVTLVEAIKQVWHLEPGAHILAAAPSNTAADLLTIRLSKHVPREEMYRLMAHSRQQDCVPDSVRVFSNLTPSGYVFPNQETLSQYRIIVTTLVTAGKLVSAQFPAGHFTHVFIDEAGQATEPETCIALGGILGPECGQLVMAGDPHQLGPIVRSSLAAAHGLARSLLERLMSAAPYYDPDTGKFDERCVKKLVRNFRSHTALLELPGRMFYAGQLVTCAEAALVNCGLQFPGLTEAALGNTPLIVHGVTGQDMREEGSPSFFNPEEIFLVLEYMKQLIDHGIDEDDIGVITPYRRQVQKLKRRLEDRGWGDVTVGTTEEFQGQERKVIVVSTVRSNPEFVNLDLKHRLGFLADAKRFNVAITRAQALLIVIGNPHILCQDKNWQELLSHARRLDCYKGCGYPGPGARQLGRMETKWDSLLREEAAAGDRARVEEMGRGAKN